jgi:hypothetical protein
MQRLRPPNIVNITSTYCKYHLKGCSAWHWLRASVSTIYEGAGRSTGNKGDSTRQSGGVSPLRSPTAQPVPPSSEHGRLKRIAAVGGSDRASEQPTLLDFPAAHTRTHVVRAHTSRVHCRPCSRWAGGAHTRLALCVHTSLVTLVCTADTVPGSAHKARPVRARKSRHPRVHLQHCSRRHTQGSPCACTQVSSAPPTCPRRRTHTQGSRQGRGPLGPLRPFQ